MGGRGAVRRGAGKDRKLRILKNMWHVVTYLQCFGSGSAKNLPSGSGSGCSKFVLRAKSQGSYLKGLSHEIFGPVFWPVWMYLGLNVNRLWFLNFNDALLILDN
jgi:hypothetical protein